MGLTSLSCGIEAPSSDAQMPAWKQREEPFSTHWPRRLPHVEHQPARLPLLRRRNAVLHRRHDVRALRIGAGLVDADEAIQQRDEGAVDDLGLVRLVVVELVQLRLQAEPVQSVTCASSARWLDDPCKMRLGTL